jgi:PAS domain S-box-containing protein
MSGIAKKSVEQKDAEAEVESFRKDLGPFVVAAETTRMAMLFADAAKPEHPIIFANDSFLSLTVYDREEVRGKSFNFLMAQGLDAEAVTRIEAEFEGTSSTGTEVLCCRNDGSEFWAAIFVSSSISANTRRMKFDPGCSSTS